MKRHITSLPNGARFVAVTLPKLHRATVVVYARVGCRYEDRRTCGLSHLVEHMIFRGTDRYPDAYAFAAAIENLGGTLHAETGIDYSLYQVSVPPSQLSAAIELLGEVFTRPRFSDLDVEKRIIREEILEDQDESGQDVNVDNVARAAAWPRHPLGYRITGTLENVDRFKLRSVRAHFEKFYRARNLLICVAGSIDYGEVRKCVRRSFRRIEPGRAMRLTAPPDRQRHPRLAFVDSPGSQTSVEVLVRAIPEGDRDYAALVALSRVLDDGLSTRLHRHVVDRLGLAYYVSAGLETFEHTGLFEVQAMVAHENAPRLVEELFRLLNELRDDPVSGAELDKAKRRYEWDLMSTLDDPDAVAGYFGGGELFHPVETLEKRCRRVRAVTADDILRVARRILTRDRLTVAAVGNLRRGRKNKLARIVEEYP